MKSLTLSLLFLAIGICSFGQSNWQEYYSSNGIKFSVKDAECLWSGQTVATNYKFIKIENTTANRARITYYLETHYQGSCNGCGNSPEFYSDFVLEPSTEVVGTCDYTVPIRLDVLVSNPSLPALIFSSFNLANITIDWVE